MERTSAQMPPLKDNLPVLPFANQQEWEIWLDANHATAAGLWIQIAKKNSGIASITCPEALDTALCYGWIDGQRASFDEVFYLQRFTPRRPKSKWSEINRNKVGDLLAQGRMKPAGLRAVEAAKRDGRWENAYKSQRNMPVPEDLLQRLEESPKAREFFQSLNSINRYAILYRIHDAKKPETRARRIEQFVAMLEERKTIY